MDFLNKSAEFVQDAFELSSEQRNYELIDARETLEAAVKSLGYLVPDGVAMHDNLGTSPEQRETEVAQLNQAFMATAAEEPEMTQAERKAETAQISEAYSMPSAQQGMNMSERTAEIEALDAAFEAPAAADNDSKPVASSPVNEDELRESRQRQAEARRLIRELQDKQEKAAA